MKYPRAFNCSKNDGSHGGMGVCSRDVDVVCGAHPVKIADLFGLHCGEATKQLANRTPSRASRSKFGVRTCVFP